MSEFLKDFLKGVLVFLMLLALGFALNYAGYLNFQFFAPKVEQARYDTFKESQAFNEATVRELYDYQVQWARATPGQRMAMRGAILHMFSTYPKEKLPEDLQLFYSRVQAESALQ